MKRTSLRREIEDLLTCNSTDVEGIYETALDIFTRYTAPGWIFSFRAASVDSKAHYDALRHRLDEASLEEVASNLSGAPILRGPTMDLYRPQGDERNRFKIVPMTGPEFHGTPLHEHLLNPFEIKSCFRILIYKGRRFTGWLGTMRSSDHPPFDPDLIRALQPLVEPLKTAYSVAEQFSRRGLTDEKMAIFSATGHLDFASRDLRGNLHADALQQLGDMVRGLNRGDLTQSVRLIDGVEVRMNRLEGGGLFGYVAQFVPGTPVLLDPLAPLTPAQRQVAIHAARGLTVPEIADVLERSPNTVKVHLREIYRRLDVSSRVELAVLVES